MSLILMHSVNCLLGCVSEMAKNYYLLPFRRKDCDKSKCGHYCSSIEAVSSPVTTATSCEKCDQSPTVNVPEDKATENGFEADNLIFNSSNKKHAIINECKSGDIFTSKLRNQEYIPIDKLSEINEGLDTKLNELRTQYKQICVELEENKANIRLQEIKQGSTKDSIIDLDRHIVHLPQPMSRSEKDSYINYLLNNVLHDLHNIHNVAMGEMLDDDVITTVMEASQLKHSDILFVNPCITQCIQFSVNEDIASFLDPINAKSYQNIFFVINDTSSGNQGTHWSLLLLSRDAKAFCHYDSMNGMNDHIAFELSKKLSRYFDTWQILDVECEQQNNNIDCGIYVLDNMLRIVLVLENDVNIEGKRVDCLSIYKLPPSFTKTRIYMMVTYINAIIQKAKRNLRLEKKV